MENGHKILKFCRMLKNLSLSIFLCLLVNVANAQDDSVSVFRKNPNTGSSNSPLNTGNRNVISFGLNHIARGGPTLCYEREFVKPNIALYAGFGISFMDIVGQYSFDSSLEFYPEDNYSVKTMESPGRIIDLGIKFLDAAAWDNSYICFGYTFISNNTKRKIDADYEVANNGARSYNLSYMSNEIKLVIGATNYNDSRLYIDGSIGPGLRFFNYQKLNITDDPFVLYNLTPQNGAREIEVDRVKEVKLKLWLYIGLKMGLRF